MNIVVLCGGLSMERDVSISSGTRIATGLRERGHNAVLIDLYFGYTETYDDPMEIFQRPQAMEDFYVGEDEPDLEAIQAMRPGNSRSLLGDNVLSICSAADIVFLALHGEDGENGKLQATLDLAGIRYTGSGYLGSALSMNKGLSKKLFREAGIHTPAGITLHKAESSYPNVGFPCVVKPCSGGSSVGTSIVYDEESYQEAVSLAFQYEEEVLVEQYIKAREFTIGVMAGSAMPVIEIIPKSGFYDYKNKYQPGCTLEICPAEISEDLTKQLQDLALHVTKVLMIDVYCRIDVLYGDDGTMYCLEANTLPGMTPTSLVPQMAAAMGIGFNELCDNIITASMEKYQ